jgi:hypothetical protein
MCLWQQAGLVALTSNITKLQPSKDHMIWEEWGRLTRFHESARLAFAREERLWNELQLSNADSATVLIQSGDRTYQVSVGQHRSAIADEQLLGASVLLYSYALAEAAVEEVLGSGATEKGGIENWSEDLLKKAGNSWNSVEGGKAGVVETAIVRNAIAHGATSYTQSDVNRILQVGGAPAWKAMDSLRLDYDSILEYRKCLKSLLRCGKVRAQGSA